MLISNRILGDRIVISDICLGPLTDPGFFSSNYHTSKLIHFHIHIMYAHTYIEKIGKT